MKKADSSAVTQVLQAAADGDRQAAAQLLPLVYEELRKAGLPVRQARHPHSQHATNDRSRVHFPFLLLKQNLSNPPIPQWTTHR